METLFQSRSWTKIETLLPEVLESAVSVMRLFETATKDQQNAITNEASVIAWIQSCKDLKRQELEATVM